MDRREFMTWLGAAPLVTQSVLRAADVEQGQATGASPSSGACWPSLDVLHGQLKQWEQEAPQCARLETLTQSAQKRPVYGLTVSDQATDIADKEQVLVTALHSGVERSGTTTVMHLVKWLLSNDPVAAETRKRQVVTFVPVVNPDGYVAGTPSNSQGNDPYLAWTLAGPVDPEKNAESLAIQQLFDRLQPEVHADIHGLDLSFPGYIMVESTGSAWSNVALRPYHQRIIDLMNEAALAEGFPTVRPEDDAERVFWGPELESAAARLWYARTRPCAGVYAYYHYHTLTLASEVCWERSGVLRHQRLLRLGNEVWPGEHYPGYPTRVVAGTEFHHVVAYGITAQARRRSRVELWNKLPQIRIGFANPQVEGLLVCLVTTSSAAAKRLGDASLKKLAELVGDLPSADAAAVRSVLAQHPEGAGQWGPCAALYMEGGDAEGGSNESPLEHGLAIRLRLPYAQARLTDLRLNGRPLAASETDGFLHWTGGGLTHVQVNVPPAAAKSQDFFLITCRYDPGERRARGWP
jgi:hypothetical protein